jgi:methylisocitrate lyase
LPVDELEAAGFAGVLYPVTALRLAMKAIETGLSLLARDGIQTELIDLEVMQTREELYELLDYNDFEERDREYFRTHLPKD